MFTRRNFMSRSALAGGALLTGAAKVSGVERVGSIERTGQQAGVAEATPITTPNGVSLPFRTINGVKVFHLTAEPVGHEFAPGLEGACWGYNGRTPGPTIEGVEGDRVRIYVTNRLREPTTVHWTASAA